MRRTLITLAAALACSTGLAQGGAASAPAMGKAGGMHGWRMTPDNTPGWSMMSPAERKAHHDKMMALTDHTACTASMEQHHAQMTARARERGRPGPVMPRRDPCAGLKK